MIDLTGKYISTENNTESGRLLKMAVAQGYRLPIGEKVMENARLFHFVGLPNKSVTIPSALFGKYEQDKIIRYGDLCGDEQEELEKIIDSAIRWCRAHGYSHVSVHANEETDEYIGKGFAKAEDGMQQYAKLAIQKPHKVTVEEIERKFGYPIEIIN